MKTICYLSVACLLLSFHLHAQRSNMPLIPVGLDAYRMWDQWPLQRPGVRAYMRSTYDRNGANESADASHFLFMKNEDHNVTLDAAGKGVLYFFRANHWHGSPWHFVVDGRDNVVRETGTADPVNAKRIFKHTTFLPEKAFPQPLAWTWAATKGADLIWAPVPFEQSLQLAYSRTRYGTGYYIYHLYANEEQLSQPIRSWDSTRAPDQDVLTLIGRAGTDIAPQHIKKQSGKLRPSEQAHAYASPQASAVEQITSRYEWGIDVFPAAPWGMDPNKLPAYHNKTGKEIYPAHTADGRYTRGTTAFTVKLARNNIGALLRRTLDYSFPNQKAVVYVADAGAGPTADSTTWAFAGTWYLAGANTCVYSDPRGELEKRQLTTQTSNRRFRDDEFMIPAKLTKNRTAIRVRVQHIPVNQELFPGFPFPRQSAWSELQYDVYSYVIPEVK